MGRDIEESDLHALSCPCHPRNVRISKGIKDTFSAFSESGIQGIEIKSTGERWYLEEPEEVQAFVRWLNTHVTKSRR